LVDLSTIDEESAKPPVSSSPTKESTNALESPIDVVNESSDVASESWEKFSFTESKPSESATEIKASVKEAE